METDSTTIKHVILGTGTIGRAIAEELTQNGKSVRMVNRSGRMEEAPAGVEIKAAELYDPARVKEVTRDAKVVYQSAQPQYHEWIEKFPPLQKSIIDGLTGWDANLVIVENLYMYGETHGRPITEDTPHNAHTRKGKIRSEMSKAALAAHQAGKVKVTMGRGSDYFGPWGFPSSMGSSVFQRLLKGKPAQIAGSTTVPHTHTDIPDFATALIMLGERTEDEGQAWHVPNDTPQITQGEFIQIVSEEIGMRASTQAAGKYLLSVLGLFTPSMAEIVEMLYAFEKPFVVDSSKFEKTFNMKATPIREAIKETVAWYKSHPVKQ